MQYFAGWYKRLQTLPRWAQSLIGLGTILLFVMVALAGASFDPSANLGSTSTGVSTFWTMLGIFWRLGLVLLVAYFSLYFLRRWQTNSLGQSDKKLKVLESHHLSPRQAIYLIRVGEQSFLIGATDQAISLLSEVNLDTDEPVVKTSTITEVSFADTFASAVQNQEQNS